MLLFIDKATTIWLGLNTFYMNLIILTLAFKLYVYVYVWFISLIHAICTPFFFRTTDFISHLCEIFLRYSIVWFTGSVIIFHFQFQKAEMKEFAKSDTSVLKQHYEKKLNEMEQEKKALQVYLIKMDNFLTSIFKD